ncbi:MAG: RluA family pseudouridine synthase [Planctomycetaceae bacterium]|nr:RluA family pseudouridine synthase [Planctomycetaceae bacterium]
MQFPDSVAGQTVDITAESRAHGWRLDHYLSRLFPNHSRAQLQKAVAEGLVTLNGLPAKASRRIRVNDRILIHLPEAEQGTVAAEDIPLSILYEDEAIIVVNKAANMVVHPGRGNYSGTLAGALQFHFDSLSDVGGRHRPGIVHRLDRDTSGVILIAKDNQVHQKVSAQFERREVRKEYRAIVRGVPEFQSDFVRTHMCVHPRVREKMTVCPEGGNAREAITYYEVGQRLGRFALMDLHPRTGRTHQLRVHMQHIGTPIVADAMYSGQSRFCRSDVVGRSAVSDVDDDVLIDRQALHAFRLTIHHPLTEREMTFEAPLPEDMQRTLDFLQQAAV